jgi:hypothetical protein
MSNKTQLQTNNTVLDGYIARINAAKDVAAGLPEASGGGSSIETCTVSISFNYGAPNTMLISGTQLVNNVVQTFVINTYNGGDTFSSPYNITNIIKNSPLTIVGDGSYALGSATCSGCELLCNAHGMECTLLKITDSNASVIINNDY